MSTLILRADAGGALGSGHVMRMLSLGQAWVSAGGRCVLAAAEIPEALAAHVRGVDGFSFVKIDALAWSADDAAAMIALAERAQTKAAVIDAYLFTPDYLEALRAGALVVTAIDDMGRQGAYPCALVVNQNLHADAALYEGKGAEHLLLGPDFAMLRPEFTGERAARGFAMVARRLLMTFGGVDPKGASFVALDALRVLGDAVEAELIIGAANPRADEIERAAAGLSNVTLARGVADLAARLARAEMVLSGAGTTVWEACALGAPMMLVASAPEEAVSASRLALGGACKFFGPVEALDGAKLAAAIEDFAGDMAARMRSSVMGQELVDGRGAGRVVAAIQRAMSAAG